VPGRRRRHPRHPRCRAPERPPARFRPIGSEAKSGALVNRDYDPGSGQFLSMDPDVDQTDQAYGYTGGDPVIESDPTGMNDGGSSWAAQSHGYAVGCAASGSCNDSPCAFSIGQYCFGFQFSPYNGLIGALNWGAGVAGAPPFAGTSCDAALAASYGLGGWSNPIFLALGVAGDVGIDPSTDSSVWDRPAAQRGTLIDEVLGNNTPINFPTIDIWEPDIGDAVSIKSIDLSSASYQSESTLRSTLTGYVNSVANFSGGSYSGLRITAGQIRSRGLLLAIPPSGGTDAQWEVIQSVVADGASQGVTVKVVIVP
jgi:RHS repeat-associated protein